MKMWSVFPKIYTPILHRVGFIERVVDSKLSAVIFDGV